MYKSLRLQVMIAGAIAFLALPVCKGHAAPGALSIRITINKDSLKDKVYAQTGIFWVETIVKNISNEKTSIIVWTQRGWSWVSDNPSVSPGIEATNNLPSTITLGPGKEYDSGVEMHADTRVKKPLTFRLGFVPNVDRPVSAVRDIENRKDVNWSNPETLRR